jgi:hypothetical protein
LLSDSREDSTAIGCNIAGKVLREFPVKKPGTLDREADPPRDPTHFFT